MFPTGIIVGVVLEEIITPFANIDVLSFMSSFMFGSYDQLVSCFTYYKLTILAIIIFLSF